MIKNLFHRSSIAQEGEDVDILVEKDSIVLERIISKGNASPKDYWYDQEQNEWVCLLKGSAELEFYDGKKVHLKEGDYLSIDAHKKHRVNWTDPVIETIWLALYY